MFKKIVPVAMLIGLAASASAQFPNDVGSEIASDFTSYKASKNGAVKVQFTSIATYFTPSVTDPKQILKSKASGTIRFFVSSNKTLSDDDRLLSSKNLKLKAFRPKFIKAKANLTAEDKGRYLLSVVDSPQDQYAANNVDSSWIPFDAF